MQSSRGTRGEARNSLSACGIKRATRRQAPAVATSTANKMRAHSLGIGDHQGGEREQRPRLHSLQGACQRIAEHPDAVDQQSPERDLPATRVRKWNPSHYGSRSPCKAAVPLASVRRPRWFSVGAYTAEEWQRSGTREHIGELATPISTEGACRDRRRRAIGVPMNDPTCSGLRRVSCPCSALVPLAADIR
jgi:hypothetical protein